MNKRGGLLDRMSNFLCDAKNSKENIVYKKINEIFKRLTDYYDIYDLEHKTNLKDIFNLLYISDEHKSFETIAEDTFIGISTLKRYTKRFNRLAERYIKNHSKDFGICFIC